MCWEFYYCPLFCLLIWTWLLKEKNNITIYFLCCLQHSVLYMFKQLSTLSAFKLVNIHSSFWQTCIASGSILSFIEKKNLSWFFFLVFFDKILQYYFYIDALFLKMCPIYFTEVVVIVYRKFQFGNCWHSVYASNAYFVSFNHELLWLYDFC